MRRIYNGLGGWLFGVFAFVVIGGNLWKMSTWAFGVFAAFVLLFVIYRMVERRRAHVLGYRIEYLSPNIVRAGGTI